MKKGRKVRRIAIGIVVFLAVAIGAEWRSRYSFQRDFERHTAIRWPRSGTMLTPSVLLSWNLQGQTGFIVKTSSLEGDRLFKEVKASPLFFEAENGAWQIRAKDRRYEFLFYASDGRIVGIRAWKEGGRGDSVKRDLTPFFDRAVTKWERIYLGLVVG